MNRISTKGLARRIEALEVRGRKANPKRLNLVLEIALRAMAWAWTPDELEQLLAASEPFGLQELPRNLSRRWAEHVDQISTRCFGIPFGALLALSQTEAGALPSLREGLFRQQRQGIRFHGADRTAP